MVLNAPLKQSQLLLSIHRCGNQGRRGSSCSPNLNKKSQKFPSFWDFAPEPRTNCMLRIPFSKNTYCIKLYFEFHCLAFSPIFAPAPMSSSSAVVLNHISSHFPIPLSDSSLICTELCSDSLFLTL